MRNNKQIRMTKEARENTCSNIRRCIQTLGTCPNGILDYTTYNEIVHYLSEFRKLIEKEQDAADKGMVLGFIENK